jgi:uncharacterized OsmC-like protein
VLGRVGVDLTHTKVEGAEGAPVDAVHVEVTVTGDLDAAQLERLEQISGRCPVARTLKVGGLRISERLTHLPV